MRTAFLPLALLLVWTFNSPSVIAQYSMPSEEGPHEGTWLQWPHNYTYGSGAEDVEASWVAMTAALTEGERVHIMAYNESEVSIITGQLNAAQIDMAQVDFYLCPTDDFWARDNGPCFVQDDQGQWVVLDWGFNGWGGDTPFALDDDVPIVTAEQLNLPLIDLNAVVLEGGAIEIDGQGTLMATRSSITGDDRNPGWTEAEIEGYFAMYLGVEQVIWLDGQFGGNEDITDQHIDGFVKFASGNTIVTMSNPDLAYWYVDAQDRNMIAQAENTEGTPYTRVNLPLTQNTVQTTWGMDLGFRSSYVNYYVGNAVVLVPEYNDPMDATALEIVQGLYPSRTAVGINCQNMLQWGGMVHCVTQQQPAGTTPLSVEGLTPDSLPWDGIEWLDLMGRKVSYLQPGQMYIQRDQNGRTKKVIGFE